ncbi:Metallo-beta-lactamase superfamily protein [Mycena kentingensis (nom. inval.)]|nr:Metallo-beta-lactamase superfamily protein [Mycena kentingensis (nom. inval.)]
MLSLPLLLILVCTINAPCVFASYKDFGIPYSAATVNLRAINIGNLSVNGGAASIFAPVLPGHESLTLAMHAFLVEHNASNTRLMFDLGVRKDVENFDFSTAKLNFSGLAAVDYFGDGSFYLIDTPGHFPGHLTALARVTPSSFVLLGGDTFMNPG